MESSRIVTLDSHQSLAVLDGVFLVYVRAVPSAASLESLLARIRAEHPWGIVQFFELERVGLPDEQARAVYATMQRDAAESGRVTALVAERLLLESIVRSVVSGLRLRTRQDGQIETFSNLEDACGWLEKKRQAPATGVEPSRFTAALRAMRDAHRSG